MKATISVTLVVLAAVALAGCPKKAPMQPVEVAAVERPGTELTPETPERPWTPEVAEPPIRERPTPDTAETATTEPPEPETKKGPTVYTVQKGDTLYAIARKFYGDQRRYRDIAKANNLADPNRIYVGQVLKIPE